jgi:N-dimethylarginine dimethylaminohydrolase
LSEGGGTSNRSRRSAAAPDPPPGFLVCPPDYFDTDFLFNPFMTYREKVRPRRARTQWRRLVRALEQAGAAVEQMEPVPLSSALPFTADGAFCFAPGRAMILRNDGPRGELEPPLFRAWFKRHGYEVESLPPGFRLDGGNLLRLPNGDLLLGLKGALAGRPERYLSSLLARLGDATTWTIGLTHERHLHLDTVVGLLGPDAYLVYGGALEGEMPAVGPLAQAQPIAVGAEDARRFACNLVVVGDVVITGPISAALTRRIERVGYVVERLDMSEFHKAGGGVKCLTLPLRPAAVADPTGGG